MPGYNTLDKIIEWLESRLAYYDGEDVPEGADGYDDFQIGHIDELKEILAELKKEQTREAR